MRYTADGVSSAIAVPKEKQGFLGENTRGTCRDLGNCWNLSSEDASLFRFLSGEDVAPSASGIRPDLGCRDKAAPLYEAHFIATLQINSVF